MTLFQSMCMFYTRFSCGNIFNFYFYFHKCIVCSHGKKRAKKIQAGKIDVNEADLFDTFRVSTTIHGRYYSETHTILGRTYGVCVLQVINFWGFSGRKIDNLRSNKMQVLLSIDSLDGCIKLEAESHKTILVSHHPARIQMHIILVKKREQQMFQRILFLDGFEGLNEPCTSLETLQEFKTKLKNELCVLRMHGNYVEIQLSLATSVCQTTVSFNLFLLFLQTEDASESRMVTYFPYIRSTQS